MGAQLLSRKYSGLFRAAVLSLLIASGCQQGTPRIYKVTTPQQRAEFRARAGQSYYSPYNPPAYARQALPESRAPDQSACDNYHIGVGDVLQVKIYQLLDLNREEVIVQKVDRQGQIYLPLINHVQVAGLTCDQVRSELLLHLGQEYIREPRVDVSIKEYASKEVLVLGAVAHPGQVVLQSDRATLLDVIGYAGGLAPTAAPDIEILRASYNPGFPQNPNRLASAIGQGSAREPYYPRLIVPAVKVFAEGGDQINPLIYPGDVVKVPNQAEGVVFLAGEVRQPGAKEFRRPLNVLQAITCAGGTTRIANEKKCKIIRRTPEGREKFLMVDLEKIQKGQQSNVLLAQNDTILVPVCPTKKFFNDLDNFIRRGINAGVDVTYDAGMDMGIPTRGTVVR